MMAVTVISVSLGKRSLMCAESRIMFASTERSLSARSQDSLACAPRLITSATSATLDISVLKGSASLRSSNQHGTL